MRKSAERNIKATFPGVELVRATSAFTVFGWQVIVGSVALGQVGHSPVEAWELAENHMWDEMCDRLRCGAVEGLEGRGSTFSEAMEDLAGQFTVNVPKW